MASTKIKFAAAALVAAGIAGTLILTRSPGQDARKPPLNPALPEAAAAASNPIPSQRVRSASASVPDAPPPPAAQRLDRALLESLAAGETSAFRVAPEQVEKFLSRNKTNAASLLAVYQATENPEFLRRAAADFPNEPAVILAAVAGNAFPENNREWAEKLKQIDPQNALPNYLSALAHLRNGEPQDALKDLVEAKKKPHYTDYTVDHLQSLEDLYLSSGRSSAEAKATAMHAVQVPQVSQIGNLANELVNLQRNYLAAGDAGSAAEVARLGLAMTDQLRYGDGAKTRLGEIVGLAKERDLVQNLDPARSYDFLREPVADILGRFAEREAAIKESAQAFGNWLPGAEYSELVSYFDHLKLYGESAALTWLENQRKTQTP